ncbi:hypothetical protein [Helicobacter zhangjianzhongii]|uniref:Uncharacterized protein n=1 Tax=Helicobacter zhangjianzhongii TaxID=2974574 RepID=A0ACC6FQB9_9HELI|nr:MULTISPECIES: hypothetical protein [unclassified Helicobacter]MDL0079658.1 hypothetical protein [Helicobacter sp. CPD2-1]MDL0081445.1 hypothetical protein [Helicobacter sp. XJK30-2]
MRTYLALLATHQFWYRIYARRIYIYGFIAVVCMGAYVGFLLFGDNSLEVLLRNIAQRDELLEEVSDLQAKNARLQKDLFELKGLEP